MEKAENEEEEEWLSPHLVPLFHQSLHYSHPLCPSIALSLRPTASQVNYEYINEHPCVQSIIHYFYLIK